MVSSVSDRCVLWHCTKYAGIESDAKLALLMDDDITWFCAPCRDPAVQAAQTDKSIEDRCKYYMARGMEKIDSVKSELNKDIEATNTRVRKMSEDVTIIKDEMAKIDDIREDIDNLKKDASDTESVNNLKTQIEEMGLQIEKNKEELSREIADRERRKISVVVVPESRSDDVDNRNQHDREAFRRICDELGLDNIDVTDGWMMQPPNQNNDRRGDEHRPRPMKIRLRNEEMKGQLLHNARRIANSADEEYRNTFIKRDMTFLERKEDFRNRETRARREDGGRGHHQGQGQRGRPGPANRT